MIGLSRPRDANQAGPHTELTARTDPSGVHRYSGHRLRLIRGSNLRFYCQFVSFARERLCGLGKRCVGQMARKALPTLKVSGPHALLRKAGRPGSIKTLATGFPNQPS